MMGITLNVDYPSKHNNRFLCYYLNYIDYHPFVTGTTRLKLNQTSMKQIPILDPPLPEQKKIVEKIEELFSGLDSGVASLKKAKEQLRLYRQSVLAHAFSGRLLQKDDIFSHSDSVQKDVIFSGKAAEPQSNYAPIKRDDIFHERDSIPKDVISNGIQLPEGLPAEDLAKAGGARNEIDEKTGKRIVYQHGGGQDEGKIVD